MRGGEGRKEKDSIYKREREDERERKMEGEEGERERKDGREARQRT